MKPLLQKVVLAGLLAFGASVRASETNPAGDRPLFSLRVRPETLAALKARAVDSDRTLAVILKKNTTYYWIFDGYLMMFPTVNGSVSKRVPISADAAESLKSQLKEEGYTETLFKRIEPPVLNITPSVEQRLRFQRATQGAT